MDYGAKVNVAAENACPLYDFACADKIVAGEVDALSFDELAGFGCAGICADFMNALPYMGRGRPCPISCLPRDSQELTGKLHGSIIAARWRQAFRK